MPTVQPSKFPEVENYPQLRRLLEVQVDMQFSDVHAMLQLPNERADLNAGCNLALANVLFSLISGASVLFFKAELGYLEKHNRAGSRFRGVLTHHYPWRDDEEAFTRAKRRELIYTYARNPLTHSFGVGKAAHLFPGVPKSGATPVYIAKGPLSAAEADVVMEGETPAPPALPPTIRSEYDAGVLSVVALAWGTVAMLRSLFADAEQVGPAEVLASQIQK